MNQNHRKNSGIRNQAGTTCTRGGQFIKRPENSLGGRVKFLRASTGFTMRGLARKIPIPMSTLQRIESNKDVTVISLMKIVDYFEVSLDYLVYGPK